MQCAILAGGLGTRMAGVTTGPKTLVPVNGVPFAAHQLSLLASAGIDHVVYSIGHLGEQVRAFVGDGSRWRLRVDYVEDGPDLLGTAGALRKALDEGVLDSPFLTLYGDSYLPIAYAEVVAASERAGLPALITVYENEDRWDRSNVVYESGVVRLYDKRPEHRTPEMRHIEYGASVVTSEALAEVEPGRAADLADVFHRLSREGRLAAHEVAERFYEVGSPAGLEALEEHLRQSAGEPAVTPSPAPVPRAR